MTRTVIGGTLILMGLMASVAAFGQQNVGGIIGTISDQSRAVVPGASITARLVDSGVSRETVSNPSGVYALTNLPIGTYAVSVKAPGFSVSERTDVRVIAAETLTLDFQLTVGTVAQTIAVRGQAPLVDATSTTTGQTRVTEEISSLPLTITGSAREARDFLFTEAGIQIDLTTPDIIQTERAVVQGVGNGSTTMSVASYIIDGVSASMNLSQAPRDEGGPMPEEIAEFRVATNLNAEAGNNLGSSIELISKSGTNQFHGTVFEYLRNDALDARNWFAAAVTPEKQNEFGGVVGGPIVKNKLFFFSTYDGYRFRTSPSGVTATVPTAKMASGDFSEWLGAQIGTDALGRPVFRNEIYDPATTRADGKGGFIRDPFQGNIIPTNRLSSLSLNFQKGYWSPTRPGISQNFVGVAAPSPINQDKISEKIDADFGANRLTFGYKKLVRNTAITGGIFDPTISTTRKSSSPEYNYRINYLRTLRPDLLLNFRTGIARDPRIIGLAGLPNGSYGCTAGLKVTYTCETPIVSIQDATGFGSSLGLQIHDPTSTVPTSLDLTWVKSRHSFKFGAQMLRQTALTNSMTVTSGSYSFTRADTGLPSFPGTTGVGYAAFLLGNVDSASMQSPRAFKRSGTIWSFYAQDGWRVTNKLTVNYGLRWDLTSPTWETYDRFASFDPTIPNPGAGGHLGAITFWGKGPGRNGRHHMLDYYYKGFGPRLGIVYAWNQKTVSKVYFGIVYGPLTAIATSGFNIPTYGWFASQTQVTPNSGVTPAFNWTNGWPTPLLQFPIIDPSIQNGSSADFYAPSLDNRPLYAENLGASFERQLPWGIALRADYVGKLSHRMYLNQPLNFLDPKYNSLGNLLLQNINSTQARAAGIPIPYPGFNGTVQQALVAYPQYTGSVNQQVSGWQNGAYHALEINAQKHFGSGMSFLIAYTLSKNLVSAIGVSPIYHIYVMPTLDRPQTLVASYTYELPFGAGKRFVNTANPFVKQLVGNWKVAGIQSYWAGQPISVSQSNLTGQPIRGASCSSFDPNNPAARYLNAAAFSVPPQFTFGSTTQLPNVRNCGYANENVSIIKDFPVGEKLRVNFAAEFFNMFNRHNWQGLTTSITSASFGNYTGVTLPREVQFHLKVEF